MKTTASMLVLFGLAMSVGCTTEAGDSKAADVASSSDPIVGGTTDSSHAYVIGLGSNSRPFCTGTVISKRTVLTAGHCYADGITKAYFGTNILNPGVRTIAVTKSERHPEFAVVHFSSGISAPTNDLAIVQLAEDAPVQPAPLLRETLAATEEFIGPKFTFVGYGDNEVATDPWFGGGGFGTKRVGNWAIDAVGPAQVGGTPGNIDATMFYYKASHLSACHGDSGGPGFFVKDGVELLAGVTSFGDARCASDGVQQRSDAPAIAGFIQAKIDEYEANDACRSDGVCNESCNTGGKIGDADCAAAHCGADGICSAACVRDPDCTTH